MDCECSIQKCNALQPFQREHSVLCPSGSLGLSYGKLSPVLQHQLSYSSLFRKPFFILNVMFNLKKCLSHLTSRGYGF